MFSYEGQKSLQSVTIKHQCPLSFSHMPAEEFKDSTKASQLTGYRSQYFQGYQVNYIGTTEYQFTTIQTVQNFSASY